MSDVQNLTKKPVQKRVEQSHAISNLQYPLVFRLLGYINKTMQLKYCLVRSFG